jgi:vitamin B12 transporter
VGGVVEGVWTLDDFLVVAGAARFRVTEAAEAYLRVENLFDEEYQRIDGFGTSELAVYAGLRTTF